MSGLLDIGGMAIGALADLFMRVVAGFFYIGIQIFGVLLGWVAAFFNTATVVTVFQFSNYFGNSEGLLIAWGILRDLANIVLLFGFVFIGIAIILGIQNYSANKALPTLIIFAVLLNFSLFFTEAVIDVSNAVGSSFFKQAGGVDCGLRINFEACASQGIAGHVISLAGAQSVFSAEGFAQLITADARSGVTAAVVYLGVLLFFIAMTFVLLTGALILISRAIALLLIMVTSPIGFAGMAIPGLEKIGDRWRNALVDNAIFAPVFILFILVGLKVAEGIKGSIVGEQGDNLLGVLVQSEASNVGGIFVMFAILIGLFVGAFIFAKQSSALGAKTFGSWGYKMAGNAAGFMTFGAAGWVGRNTVGRGASGINRMVLSSNFARTNPALARVIAGGAGQIAGSSFDARSKIKIKDVDLGSASAAAKKGYAGVKKEEIERRVKFAEDLKQTGAEKRTTADVEREAKTREAGIKTMEANHRADLNRFDAESRNRKSNNDREFVNASDESQGRLNELKTIHANARSDQEREINLAKQRLSAAATEEDKRAAAVRLLQEEQILNEMKNRHEQEKAAAERREKAALNALRVDHDRDARARETTRTGILENQRRLIDEEKTVIESLKNETTRLKQAPQSTYADTLERNSRTLFSRPSVTVTSRANKDAAEKIRKNLKKTKKDELFDLIREVGGDVGGPPPTPPTPPPAAP
jgi:hypothetical protein